MLHMNKKTQHVVKGTLKPLNCGSKSPNHVTKETSLHSQVGLVRLLRKLNLIKEQINKDAKNKLQKHLQ